MQELISTAILIANLFGGTIVANKISNEIKRAAITKSAHGLPSLSEVPPIKST